MLLREEDPGGQWKVVCILEQLCDHNGRAFGKEMSNYPFWRYAGFQRRGAETVHGEVPNLCHYRAPSWDLSYQPTGDPWDTGNSSLNYYVLKLLKAFQALYMQYLVTALE